MVIVGVAAVDLALGGDLIAYRGLFLVVGIAPGTVAVEVGLLMLVTCRGRARAFWAGFVMAGALAATSYLWSMIYGRPVYFAVRNGRLIGRWWGGGQLGSPWNGLANLWHSYALIAAKCVELLPFEHQMKIRWWDSEPKVMVVSALLLFLPQLLMAVMGGLLGQCIAWIVGRRRGCAAIGSISGGAP